MQIVVYAGAPLTLCHTQTGSGLKDSQLGELPGTQTSLMCKLFSHRLSAFPERVSQFPNRVFTGTTLRLPLRLALWRGCQGNSKCKQIIKMHFG